MGLKLHEVWLFNFSYAKMATFGGHFHYALCMERLLFYAKHCPLALNPEEPSRTWELHQTQWGSNYIKSNYIFNFLLAKWPSFAAIFITLWIQKVFCFMLSIFLWSSQLWGAKPHLGVAPNTMGLKLRNGSNLKIQIQFDPSILKVGLWLLLCC